MCTCLMHYCACNIQYMHVTILLLDNNFVFFSFFSYTAMVHWRDSSWGSFTGILCFWWVWSVLRHQAKQERRRRL